MDIHEEPDQIDMMSEDELRTELRKAVGLYLDSKLCAERYEIVRRLNPREFRELWMENLNGKGRFDDLVDARATPNAESSNSRP
jgi:ribosomal protein L20